MRCRHANRALELSMVQDLERQTVQPSHTCCIRVGLADCQAGRGGGGLDNRSARRQNIAAMAGRATSHSNREPHSRRAPPTNLPLKLTPGRGEARRQSRLDRRDDEAVAPRGAVCLGAA
jgi:hypothetical protein